MAGLSQGADPEAMDRIASQFDKQAHGLAQARSASSRAVAQLRVLWTGPDSAAMAASWPAHERELEDAVGRLTSCARTIRSNAAAQRTACAADLPAPTHTGGSAGGTDRGHGDHGDGDKAKSWWDTMMSDLGVPQAFHEIPDDLYTTLRDAGLSSQGWLQEGSRLSQTMEGVSRAFFPLNALADVNLLINPDKDSWFDASSQRVLAGSNLLGMIASGTGEGGLFEGLLGSGGAEFGGFLAGDGLDGSLLALNAFDEIPVAGEVIAVGTGLVLAGDFLYHHWDDVENLATGAWHGIKNAGSWVGHGLSSAWHGAGHFVSSLS